jgi:hypothetical protein
MAHTKYHHAPGCVPVTDHELRLLQAIEAAKAQVRPVDGTVWVMPSDLMIRGILSRDGSVQGYHQTAASLLRKRLLYRQKLGGLVHYALTTQADVLLASLQLDKELAAERAAELALFREGRL